MNELTIEYENKFMKLVAKTDLTKDAFEMFAIDDVLTCDELFSEKKKGLIDFDEILLGEVI
jgi:hypothetical protein